MTVMGVDEVGRGCWAGPLVAGAVILSNDYVHDVSLPWKLTDSKRMTKVQRQQSAEKILELALAYGLGWVEAAELDRVGLTAAVRLAMQRAVVACRMSADKVIVDGSYNFLSDMPNANALIKADASVIAVSAASIIAKVARDHWMVVAAQDYPGYGFERHVGYGTAQHRIAITKLGICPLHRRSFKPIAAYQPLNL